MKVLRTKLGSSARATMVFIDQASLQLPGAFGKDTVGYYHLGKHSSARSHIAQEAAAELLTTEWLGSSSAKTEKNMTVLSRGRTSAVLLAI